MPRKKKNTEYRIGAAGIIPPIVEKFLHHNHPPESWGVDDVERRKATHFMAFAAARPGDLNTLDGGTPLPEFVEVERERKHGVFVYLFQQDPDFALKLMGFVRGALKVGFEHGVSAVRSGMAYLRDGATQRFKKKEGREPTDDELSRMIKGEYGLEIPSETFGAARELLMAEDSKLRTLAS
jgi:hypothetical protein